jgi:hypothetical protein
MGKNDKILSDFIDELILYKELHTPPGEKVIKQLIQDIFSFLKDNKDIKIYGGTAIDAVKKIYHPDKIPDIDCYTPAPRKLSVGLANFLLEKGHKDITVVSGVHESVYKVRAYNRDAADFSYVPENLFKVIPVNKINGINYVKIDFLLIDLFKSLAFPKENVYRWEKDLSRLEKVITEPKKVELKYKKSENDYISVVRKEFDKKYIATGIYSAHILLGNLDNIEYLEYISEKEPEFVNYFPNAEVEICKANFHKEMRGISEVKIKYYNPLSTKFPRKYIYTVNGTIVAIIYTLSDQTLSCVNYYTAKVGKEKIKTTNYHYTMAHLLMMKYIGGIVGSPLLGNLSEYYYYLLYQANKKKPFPVFQLDCIGTPHDAKRQANEKKWQKIDIFKYSPHQRKIEPANIGTGAVPNHAGELFKSKVI